MQTKRKLILGFLLAGFGLLAACGNNPEDQNKKVGEGQNCDTEKKCDDSLKCFKKAAGETGGTCQKPCDPQAPNACGSKPNMCKEHELLDGNKDHMCMSMGHHHGPDKTWHDQCDATDQSGHACHPLHAEDKAACVTLTGAAHATCEHTCAGGKNDCPKDKTYKCEDVGNQKICVPDNKVVGSVCDKTKESSCFSNAEDLVCVEEGGSSTCKKKCDPAANSTVCSDTQDCRTVGEQSFCKEIPVKLPGSKCVKNEGDTCFNKTMPLECVELNGKNRCAKTCTPSSGSECGTTHTCKDIGGKNVCVAKPNKQVGDACTDTEADTCFNANFTLSCINSKCQRECDDNIATITTSQCEANQLCNLVDGKKVCEDKTTTKAVCLPVYDKMRDGIKPPKTPIFHEDNASVLNADMTKTETDGIKELIFNSGIVDGLTNRMDYVQNKSAMYLDLDSGEAVAITDKEALNSNQKWDVAFRSYEFYVNGGLFQGDLSLAKVDGSEEDFKNATFDSVKGMAATEFKVGAELDPNNSCSYQTYTFGPFSFPRSAAAVANGVATWCGYGANHQPEARPDVYYILRNSTGTWFAKLLIKKVQSDPGNTIDTQFTIQYKVL